MAATGQRILRKLPPSPNVGRLTSILIENLHMRNPSASPACLERKILRSLYSLSALESSAKLTNEVGSSHKARATGKCDVEAGAEMQRPSGTKRRRALAPVLAAPPQRAPGALARGRYRLRGENGSSAEENILEQKYTKVKPRGELTEEADRPSAYVTTDLVDYRAMQLVFLGTSSSIPTWNRSTSSVALRLDGTIFLFDCGEGVIRQILKTPMKHYDISHIFITHMHGDHVFGLPGLLCRIGLKEFQSKNPIHVYGPPGLRQWIRSTLKASHARVHPRFAVHEMISRKLSSSVTRRWNLVEENHNDELTGMDIECSTDGLWHIYADDKYIVRAGLLRHTIPCWGYIVEERTRRGRFNVERALQAGVRPGPSFRMLETGNSVTLPNGKVVSPGDVLGPPRRGRKVVILGDTCDSKSLVAAAKEADVVVHEATVLEEDASEVYQRGHSTARMAGKFARMIKAGTLVLTHFSRKLDGARFEDEKSHGQTTIKHLLSDAEQAFRKGSVIAAEDFMAITVQLVDKPPVKVARSDI